MKELGKEYKDPEKRRAFLEANAYEVEKKSYMKPFTPEELQERQVELSKAMIELRNLEEELKNIRDKYRLLMKPLEEQRERMLNDVRNKAAYVTEDCYKFVDQDEKLTTYYNAQGDMVEERPCTASEMQRVMHFDLGVAANE